jgi:putative phage-type endonuclease
MARITIQPKNEQEWLTLRLNDITSTKSPALFGISPYLTKFELWHRIKNNLVVDFKENKRMKWGIKLEASIAECIAEEKGWEVRPFKEYIRLEEEKIGSSFDFRILDNDKGDGILEIKNVDGLVYRDNWIDGEPPLHIEMQVQHQLLVSGLKYAYIGVLVGGNDEKLIYRERDEIVINRILEESAKFWKSIKNNEPPDPNFNSDAVFLKELYQHAEPGTVYDARGDERINEIVSKYKEASQKEKEAKSIKESCKSELLTIIGDNEKAAGDDFTISAGVVAEAEISYIRKPYRTFKINFRRKK